MKKVLSSCLLYVISFFALAQNQNVSGGAVFEGEPFIVVNPANSSHIVVAWMGYTGGPGLSIKTKVSFNGGNTWSTVHNLPHHAVNFKSADPSLAFDNLGNLFACYIDYRESPDSGGVYVIKSSDGGLSWSGDVKAIDMYADGVKKPIDRPWMSINPANNHIYITSKPPSWVLPPNRPYFISSLTGGATWQAIRYADTIGHLCGNLIAQPMASNAVNSLGEVVVAYPTYVPTQNVLPGFLLAKSANDGASFSYNNLYFAVGGSNDTLAKLGYKILVNPSNPNHFVFVFLAKPNGDIDAYTTESFNGGSSWSGIVRVNDDLIANGKMQDLVWADFDEDGDLAVAWRDRRNASGTGYSTDSEIWGSIKWKDSSTYSQNFKISDTLALYNALYLTQSGNDFMGIDMMKDTLNSVWGDVRNGVLNIYFSRKALRGGSTSVQLLNSEEIDALDVYPNPTSDKVFIEGLTVKSLLIYNTEGKKLDEFDHIKSSLSLEKYPKGLLILVFDTADGVVVKRILKN